MNFNVSVKPIDADFFQKEFLSQFGECVDSFKNAIIQSPVSRCLNSEALHMWSSCMKEKE